MAFKKQDTMIDINTLNSLLPQADRDLSNEFDSYCVHGDIRNPNFDGPFGYDDIGKTACHFVQWQKKRDIEKACEWLNKNVVEYHSRTGELRPIVNINAFREAIENEQ